LAEFGELLVFGHKVGQSIFEPPLAANRIHLS
jgi:hypothetical protein